MQQFGRLMPALSTGKPPVVPLIFRFDVWDAASSLLPAILNEFLKRDVKKTNLPRPEAEKIVVLRSSPLIVSAPRFRSREM